MVNQINRKSLLIRHSGRSTDYISPSFGFGCLLDCSYCYMKRHTNNKNLSYAKNIEDILSEINNHVYFYSDVEKPNQTDKQYITYDISCNEDFALHSKFYNWEKIFDFFKYHSLAKGSLATKIIPNNFLSYNPNKKIRIRFSLMPEKWREILEPNTSTIRERLESVRVFLNAGYEVHLNFSPVIVHDNWLDEYKELFRAIHFYANANAWIKDISVKAEVIFLTHNEAKHEYNLAHQLPGEELLWVPKLQEEKTSQYGGKNLRYEHNRKADYIKQFVELHDELIPWNTIRYIF